MDSGAYIPAFNAYGGHSGPGQQQQHHSPQQQQQQQSQQQQQQQQQQQPPPPPQSQQQQQQQQQQQPPQQQQPQQTSNQQNLASFGSLSAQGHQQQSSPTHPTLPPLQSQNGSYSQYSSVPYGHPGNQAQTPTTPHTPVNVSMGNTSSSNATAATVAPPHAFSHLQNSSNAGPMLPPNFGAYTLAQSMYPNSTSSSLPPTSASGGLPTIRPMPPGGVAPPSHGHGLPGLANAGGQLGQLAQQSSYMQNEEAPTHVVGSQGRRGILPSAPGRPMPPAQGSVQATKNMIPQKDADGKYPCPHCNKTYLHAKHLKRHLLRHTGDRPYMCHLCKDTFSRSDILKRHFQKCSLRRGNPTGANHLAHQRRNTGGNRLSISQQDGPIGLAGLPEVAGASAYNSAMVGNGVAVNGDVSARSSRTNSLISPGTMSHRNSVAGLGILGSNAPSNDQMVTTAGYTPAMSSYAMHNTSNGGQMPPSYAFNNASQMNGNMFNNPANHPQQMSFLGHQSSRFDNSQHNSPHPTIPNGDGSGSSFDWTRMFTQGGQDGFIGSQPANASSRAIDEMKPEHDNKHDFHTQPDFSSHSFLGNLYSHPNAFGGEDANSSFPGLPKWGMDDPLQAKVDSLVRHCFPNGIDAIHNDAAAELMYACLKLENVKHFVDHYTSYHGHWPILHMPTFKLTDADNNLVLAILCIGAVYSPKLGVQQVRLMMDFVKSTVLNSCSIYGRTISGQTNGLGVNGWEIEELQALSMLQTLFTWHGDPLQRQTARDDFPVLVQIAKAMGLCRSAPQGTYAYSHLHSTSGSPSAHIDANAWNWNGWLEQEKRNRALYQIFLTDAAMVLYFNSTSQFDPMDIRLSLPADDAAWDASDPQACASALGLNGQSAQDKNLTGTCKPRQPGMRDAMRMLLDPTAVFACGITNAYSKFILIHALMMRIIAYQKIMLQGDAQMHSLNFALNSSTPATPLSQNEWLEQHGNRSGSISANNSGNGTPTDSYSPSQAAPAQQEKKRLSQALDKWKRAWDVDMEVQYPSSQVHLKRFGFIRDGVHFFFLGRNFLQSPTGSDWTISADQRFKRVMGLLKRIKSMVKSESGSTGQDIGSVGDIDDQYGLDNLTLDMKLLFKPYDSLLDSPVAGVQTHSL